MNLDIQFRLIGKGIYTIPDVARYTGLSYARARNWIKGYNYQYHGEMRETHPIVTSNFDPIDNSYAISFLDLIEIRFIKEFLKFGISLRTIKAASIRAQELLRRSHPFSTNVFRTDGRTILADIAEEEQDKKLMDLIKQQYEIYNIFGQFLYKSIDFSENDYAIRWYPHKGNRTIVIDPSRCLGQPIIDREGVPTAALWNSYRVEQDFQRVARWFEVREEAIRDAVIFEESLAA